MSGTTLSQDFITNVRTLYGLALDQMVSNRVVRHRINCYTNHAAPAYVSAVAAIEAFLNEIVFGSPAKSILHNSPL